MAFEQLKKKLQAEGLFEQSRKRPLPLSAAQDRHRDVARRRRAPRHHQGARTTAPECAPGDSPNAGAGRRCGRRHRGSARAPSSRLRAWTSSSSVAAAARSRTCTPSIRSRSRARLRLRQCRSCPRSGHEVDVTIADFVADLRAPTPSAAAELVVTAKDEFCARVSRLSQRLGVGRPGRCAAAARGVHALTQPPRAGRVARPARDARTACGGADVSAGGRVGGVARSRAGIAPIARCDSGSKPATFVDTSRRFGRGWGRRAAASTRQRPDGTPSGEVAAGVAGRPAREPQPARRACARLRGLLECDRTVIIRSASCGRPGRSRARDPPRRRTAVRRVR